MPRVVLNDANNEQFYSDGFSREENGQTLQIQAVVAVDPVTGQPNSATESTLSLTNELLSSALHVEDSAHASGDTGQMMLGIRWDSDESTADDGDYTVLKLDEKGRLKVATQPSSYADITGSITAVQATIGTPVAGGTVEGDVSRASNAMVFCTGTFSAVTCVFEGSIESSGNTNWFGINAARSNANTVETTTGALSAQPVYAWEMSVNGLKRMRVRCTARTSGTQNWRFVLGSYATEPIPINPVTSMTSNIGTCSPLLYADTTTVLAASAVYTGTSRDAATTPTYQIFCARAYASHAGVLTHQDSTDNTTWRNVSSIALEAGETKTLENRVLARYNRVLYTNGSTLQTAFRVTSGYHKI